MVPEEGVVCCFVPVQHLFEERVMEGDWGQSCYYHQSLNPAHSAQAHSLQVLGKIWKVLR
jgi:hypothetical protein